MKPAIALFFALLLPVCACTSTTSYNLLPGQTLRLANTDYSHLEIESEYPVSVAMGDGCQYARVVSARLDCPAADITISDLRPAVLVWSHSNRVQVRAR